MSKIGEMNLTLNAKAVESIMTMKRENSELRARVAELEGERTQALDMVRDRLDADPSTMTEAVDGLTKLYKMEHDERFKLQAQLDWANAIAEDRRKRIRTLDDDVTGIAEWAVKRGWKRIVPLYRWVIDHVDRATKPRPMSEAPRDGEFWGIVPLTYDVGASEHTGSPVYRDRDSDQHMAESGHGWTYITGWLPTSSGGEGE